jgi:hypothetical protein
VAEVGDASFAPGRPKVVAVVVEDQEDGRARHARVRKACRPCRVEHES